MMVKISGIPKIKEEDTNSIVVKLAKKLDVSLSPKDLDVSHRTNNKKDAPIIVKFNSRRARDIL